ncbi:hypothetical protein [Mobilisporobacter senegalensis]|nr:hypothetical protein [Mobilisporobacter senegalensis]
MTNIKDGLGSKLRKRIKSLNQKLNKKAAAKFTLAAAIFFI